jgi:hypothetical protein
LKAVRPRRRWLQGRSWRSLVGGLAVLLLAAAAIAAVVIISGGGGGGGGGVKAKPIAVAAATDYDPEGDDSEHPEVVGKAVDDNPAATGGAWTTETYITGPALADSGKDGVGIYLDAGNQVSATDLEVRSSEGGWDLTIYGSPGPPPEDISEWTQLGAASDVKNRQTISLDTGENGYRYYLLWITRLAGSPGDYRVEITDVRLFN